MDTKRKRTHESSSSEPLQDAGIDALLATVGKKFKSMEATVSENSSQIQELREQAVQHAVQFQEQAVQHAVQFQEHAVQFQEQAVQIQKLRKQAVKDRGLALVNEFVGFVSQVHGTGMQQKFDPGYQTGKFNKLRTNQNFGNDCSRFLDGVKSASEILTIFSTDTRNRLVHFSEPEDCVSKIRKFQEKNTDLIMKCTEEVQFCVSNIQTMALHFVGTYRLKRLACQFVGRFLASHGYSWVNMKELQKVLKKAMKSATIHGFKPYGMMDADFISKVVELFEESKHHGPRYTGASKDDSDDFLGIQSAFQKCRNLEMLPSKALHAVEYSILEFSD